jgi:hypothetical protein
VLRSRKCRSIHRLPHTASWRSAELVKLRENLTFYLTLINGRRKDSSVNIAMVYRLEDRGLFLVRTRDFPLPYSVQRSSGAHPASYPNDTWDFYSGVGGKAAGTLS